MISYAERLNLHLKENVIGVGKGYKRVNGKMTGEVAMVCTVIEKEPIDKLREEDLIPATIDGIPTDVIVSSPIKALDLINRPFRPLESATDELPAQPGNSIGHVDITAGTFGWLPNGFIHSNNHVMANSNQASIGDPILFPGPHDGGTYPDHHIANLFDFEPIKFIGVDDIISEYCKVAQAVAWTPNKIAALLKRRTRLVPFVDSKDEGDLFPENVIDGAIAEPLNPNMVRSDILTIGEPTGLGEATLGMAVHKHGRTTDYRTGTVSQVEFSLQVQYGEGLIAMFVDQFVVEHNGPEFGAGGDSGSCVLCGNLVVGTLYAGSAEMTIMNHIKHHAARFNF